jgi:translation initiation factor 4B
LFTIIFSHLVSSALGSWADEMESLPNARECSQISTQFILQHLPLAAARIDEESGDRFGRRDDFLTSRCESPHLKGFPSLTSNETADRQNLPPRDDVPLPTQPPYTAFIGNLAFDLSEGELQQFFSGLKVRQHVSSSFAMFLTLGRQNPSRLSRIKMRNQKGSVTLSSKNWKA